MPAVQLNKQLPASITIFNPSGERLAFKVGGGQGGSVCYPHQEGGCQPGPAHAEQRLLLPAGQDNHTQEVCGAAQLGKQAGRQQGMGQGKEQPVGVRCTSPASSCRSKPPSLSLAMCTYHKFLPYPVFVCVQGIVDGKGTANVQVIMQVRVQGPLAPETQGGGATATAAAVSPADSVTAKAAAGVSAVHVLAEQRS